MIPILVRKVEGTWYVVCPASGARPCASWAAAMLEATACARLHGIRVSHR